MVTISFSKNEIIRIIDSIDGDIANTTDLYDETLPTATKKALRVNVRSKLILLRKLKAVSGPEAAEMASDIIDVINEFLGE
jgi:hypothetical protein